MSCRLRVLELTEGFDAHHGLQRVQQWLLRAHSGRYVPRVCAQLSAAVIVSAPRQGREQDNVTYMYWHVAHRTCGCALLNIGTTSLRMMSMAIEE